MATIPQPTSEIVKNRFVDDLTQSVYATRAAYNKAPSEANRKAYRAACAAFDAALLGAKKS